jgi:hypothetical protein
MFFQRATQIQMFKNHETNRNQSKNKNKLQKNTKDIYKRCEIQLYSAKHASFWNENRWD